MIDTLVIKRPDDFHCHLRRGPSMSAFARREAASFGRALAMPNTAPPIASGKEAEAYRREILAATAGAGPGAIAFEPLIAFKLLPGMPAATVRSCAAAGAVAGKYYPAGATTNSGDGPSDPAQVEEALVAMEETGLVLCIHAEDPEAPSLSREAAFLPRVEAILARHPRLRIVLEHISVEESLAFLRAGPDRLGATVTAHHLLLCLDDLIGEALNPHLFCKPVLKEARHRDALRDAVLGGQERLFFGSDSAPHPRQSKEGKRAASGVYSAPTAMPAMAALFALENRLPALEAFVAGSGAAFYGLRPASGSLELIKEDWIVPEEIDGTVPFLAGAKLAWRLGRIAS